MNVQYIRRPRHHSPGPSGVSQSKLKVSPRFSPHLLHPIPDCARATHRRPACQKDAYDSAPSPRPPFFKAFLGRQVQFLTAGGRLYTVVPASK